MRIFTYAATSSNRFTTPLGYPGAKSSDDNMIALPPSPAIACLKRALRKDMRGRLAQIEETSLILQSRTVSTIVKDSSWYKSSKKIACYLSMDSGELRTDDIVLDALASGKEVYVPYCAITDASKRDMKMLKLDNMSVFSNLAKNTWGIREYLPSQVMGLEEGLNQGLDLILMPGLGFDRSGGRLGHGRGYYDAYLSKLKLQAVQPIDGGSLPPKMPMLVGLALSEQILPEDTKVPTAEHDHSLDLLVGPSGPIIPDLPSVTQS